MATQYWLESIPAEGSERCGDFATCIDLAPQKRAVIVGDIADAASLSAGLSA